jgi:hypothetical protein
MDAVEIPLPAKVDFGKILITSAAEGVDGAGGGGGGGGGGEVLRRCADADRRSGGNNLLLLPFFDLAAQCAGWSFVLTENWNSFRVLRILLFGVIFCCSCHTDGHVGVVCWVSR